MRYICVIGMFEQSACIHNTLHRWDFGSCRGNDIFNFSSKVAIIGQPCIMIDVYLDISSIATNHLTLTVKAYELLWKEWRAKNLKLFLDKWIVYVTCALHLGKVLNIFSLTPGQLYPKLHKYGSSCFTLLCCADAQRAAQQKQEARLWLTSPIVLL